MSDREITHAVVEMFVNVIDRSGQPLAELIEGLPVTERRLRGWVGGLDWDVFVEMFERLDARVGRERLTEEFCWLPDISPIGRSLFSRLVSPQALLGFVARVMGPSMFPMYESSYDDGARSGNAVIQLRLREGFRGCRAIFEVHGPSMGALPLFLGKPAFPTRTEATERGGTYTFTVPR